MCSLIASSSWRMASDCLAWAGQLCPMPGATEAGRGKVRRRKTLSSFFFGALVSLFVVEPCVPIPPLRADGPRNVVA